MFLFRVLILLLASVQNVGAGQLPAYLVDPTNIDPQYPPAMSGFTFDSHGQPLDAIVYLANGKGPHPVVVLLHGFPGNEKNLDLAQAIRRAGWNVVFFHYRGSWGSAGAYSIPKAIEDVAAAVRFLRNPALGDDLRIDAQKIALVGHSFGGFFALHGTAHSENIACVAALAPTDIGGAAKRARATNVPLWPWLREMPILKGFDRDAAITDIYARIDDYDLKLMAGRLISRPTLLVTPDGDGIWPVQNQTSVSELFRTAGVDITFQLVANADHAFSAKRIRLAEIVTDWLNHSCLPPVNR